MKVTIQSIHFTAAERLKNYVQKKCDKFDQFFDRIIEGKVSLKLQKEAKGADKLVE
ncbi:MAG: HPF/RaiA family ribosome-associated protein, partial [Bacteroidota bacterium]